METIKQTVHGHAYTDDHWKVSCPMCDRDQEFKGFFDSGDIISCDHCGTVFRCARIVFDDDSYIN